MKSKACIFIKNVNLLKTLDLEDYFLVGVDKGAYELASNNINMDLAIGDFDSISSEELAHVKAFASIIKTLNPIKDNTDTYEAYIEVKDYSSIIILGAIQGKRIEHFLANLNLLKSNKNIILKDENSIIYKKDSYFKITKSEYKYYSFFAIEETVISLDGFKYPLSEYSLSPYDSLTISNELIEDEGSVNIDGGSVVIIESKNDR